VVGQYQKLLIWFSLLLGIQLMMTQAYAAQTKIFAVTNDDDHKNYDLYLETDDTEKVTGLKMYDKSLKQWESFNINGLEDGAVLKKSGDHKVIVLKSNDFEKDRGGNFKVDYLSNGITGSRKDMEITVDFDGHKWAAFHEGVKINLLDFKVKKVFRITVGIKKVIVK
ncbi:hypothetical protein OAT67_03005, partial [Bacteriovoracaceae bacterium]|nr:hypothetical protein [Bacteriovoracaceae bacterium]